MGWSKVIATTSCKNIEILTKTGLSYFKSLVVTCLCDRILTSLPFKVVPPSFERDLGLLTTYKGRRGESQAQDHGPAIQAKIRYRASSIFATGCSSYSWSYPGFHGVTCNSFFCY